MWLSKDIVGFFQISHEHVRELSVNLAKAQAENQALRLELQTLKVNFDWLRTKVNALELERAQLIEKAYNISLPAPALQRHVAADVPDSFSFEHIDDELARRLGMPVFGTIQTPDNT